MGWAGRRSNLATPAMCALPLTPPTVLLFSVPPPTNDWMIHFSSCVNHLLASGKGQKGRRLTVSAISAVSRSVLRCILLLVQPLTGPIFFFVVVQKGVGVDLTWAAGFDSTWEKKSCWWEIKGISSSFTQFKDTRRPNHLQPSPLCFLHLVFGFRMGVFLGGFLIFPGKLLFYTARWESSAGERLVGSSAAL